MRKSRPRSTLLLATVAALGISGVAHAEKFQCGRTGGDFTYGLEANVAGLDMQANAAASVRDIAMNTYETLVTRDENMKPLLQLAQSVEVSPDSKIYTFKLRQGVHFHNGKPFTSADARASFERYARVGIDRSILAPVDHYDTPDPSTFVIAMKDARPSFVEAMSSITVPIIIIPEENKDAPPQQLAFDGDGALAARSVRRRRYVKLKRFEGYTPDTRYDDLSGFGGYKVACLNTVTFRMVPEPGARVAGLETGELQGVAGCTDHRAEADRGEQGYPPAEAGELLAECHLWQLVGAAYQQPQVPSGSAGGSGL